MLLRPAGQQDSGGAVAQIGAIIERRIAGVPEFAREPFCPVVGIAHCGWFADNCVYTAPA